MIKFKSVAAATFLFASVAGISLMPTPAQAQGADISSPVEFARRAETLKPGQWVSAAEIAPRGPVTVYVDVARQLATVYRNGVRIAVTTVSTGKKGHDTPMGVFTILQKDAKHRSSTYNNAPMPYQQRLTWDGVALHAGGLPGYPESHGCVHLPMAFAKKLFATTEMGGTVVVSGRAGSIVSAPSAGVLAAIDQKGAVAEHIPLAANEQFRWTPELSPSGPVSIIVSRSDQRIVILRNGTEIGRARVELPTSDLETHVFTYAVLPDGKPHWMVAGVPGHEGEAGNMINPWTLSNLRMPSEFLKHVRTTISSGTTVLVTQAPMLPTNSGSRMTVLSSVAR